MNLYNSLYKPKALIATAFPRVAKALAEAQGRG